MAKQISPAIKCGLLGLGILCCMVVGQFFHGSLQGYQDFLTRKQGGLFAYGIFLFCYVGLTALIWVGPKDILRVVAAVAYGPWLSTLLVWIGESLNVVVMFMMSRRLGREFVAQHLKGRVQRLDQAIATTSVGAIFWMRFFPVIPFRFLDLGFGLTKISLKKYWTIAVLASPVRIFFTQFFLSLGPDVMRDPGALTVYLEKHPRVLLLVMSYFVGAFLLMVALKRRQKR